MFRLVLVCLLALGLSQPALGGQGGPDNVGPALPGKLRGLLVQEMNAILDASKTIQDALIRGDSETVAQQAQQIHDSFILKQKMTPADKKALKKAVPKAFIQRDQAFHKLSGRLADAARAGHQERQERLFTKMIRACAGCHERHAQGRFPGLQ
jgi:cytochrome c553